MGGGGGATAAWLQAARRMQMGWVPHTHTVGWGTSQSAWGRCGVWGEPRGSGEGRGACKLRHRRHPPPFAAAAGATPPSPSAGAPPPPLPPSPTPACAPPRRTPRCHPRPGGCAARARGGGGRGAAGGRRGLRQRAAEWIGGWGCAEAGGRWCRHQAWDRSLLYDYGRGWPPRDGPSPLTAGEKGAPNDGAMRAGHPHGVDGVGAQRARQTQTGWQRPF